MEKLRASVGLYQFRIDEQLERSSLADMTKFVLFYAETIKTVDFCFI